MPIVEHNTESAYKRMHLADTFVLYLNKVSSLMFDNNFGKCGPISKFFHQLIHNKIIYVYITKISTSPAICCYTT